MKNLIAGALCLGLIACGPNASTLDASAQNQNNTAQGNTSAASSAEQTGVLTAANLRADAQGRVENECGEKVTPKLIPVDLGIGRTILLAMEGGPNMASCYGDGPGLTLFKQNGSGWREIYSSRGGFMAVLLSTHQGARDLAFAGPGFSHATYFFDGSAYTPSNQEIADEAMGNAAIYPQ